MTDQQRADICAREGFPLDTTPFLDSFAARGAWFNRAYSTMPVCGPARVSLLTGRYPSATRVRTNHNIEDAAFEKDMFLAFRSKGYKTGLCGKNHSHLRQQDTDFWCEYGHLGGPASNAEEKAFDAFLQTTHFHLHSEASPHPVHCQLPHRIVTRAIEWLESLSGDPFLLWVSFPEPHNPYQVPEPYFSMFPSESLPPTTAGEEALQGKGFPYQWCRRSFEEAFPGYPHTIQRARANYMGMLRLIDKQVSRLVDHLDRSNLLKNTIVVFLSDHGDFVGEYGLLRKGPELPESLIRIPLIFHGPGIIPSSSPMPAHVSIADIFPTLCEAASIPIPDGVQGRSFWGILTGETEPPGRFESAYAEQGFGGMPYDGSEDLDPRSDGFEPSPDGRSWGGYDCLNSRTQSGSMRMVRRGDWKLITSVLGSTRLYHLPSDPAELTDLAPLPECRAVVQEMTAELASWMLRLQDPLPLPRRRYVIKPLNGS